MEGWVVVSWDEVVLMEAVVVDFAVVVCEVLDVDRVEVLVLEPGRATCDM